MGDFDSGESPLDLDTLVGEAVEEILSHEDPQRFRQWFQQHVQTLARPGAAFAGDPDMCRAFATVLGMAIWNATPLPGNRFRPAPLPAVGRNDRCPCGSGAKFKQCCGIGPPIDGISTEFVWGFVLDALAPEALASALRERAVPVAVVVGHAADLLMGEEDPESVVALLEPLFEPAVLRLDTQPYAHAFDLLVDAYDMLGLEQTRLAFIERIISQTRRSPLRAAARQRSASVRMDAGDADGAWQAFAEAQRDAPDSSNLAHLEILLLAGEGRTSEIPARARTWIRRLQRRGYETGDRVVDWLQEVIEDPDAALLDLGIRSSGDEGADLRRWLAEVRERPLPAGWSVAGCTDLPVTSGDDDLRARLRDMGIPQDQIATALEGLAERLASQAPVAAGDENAPAAPPDSLVLVAPPEVRATERRWREVFPGAKPFSIGELLPGGESAWDSEQDWGAFLADNPQAFDSIDILDDLATAVMSHSVQGVPVFDRGMLVPLLERVERIVESALAGVPGPRLAWIVGENRPALRSLSRLADWEHASGEPSRALMLYERVIVLNPEDNHGHRCVLADEYLRAGRNEDVVSLAARFPDDLFAETVYGKALALHRLQRDDDAMTALAAAVERLPEVARMLLRKRLPARAASVDEHFSIGSAEQARYYWEAMRGEWEATPGALAWLKKKLAAEDKRR